MLIVENVRKVYRVKEKKGWLRQQWKQVEAVSDVSFRMVPGKIIGLLGINGAGKTTTIKMCSTLLTPTSGTITVDGYDAVKDDRFVKAKVNMIAGGERMLYWRLTGRENLQYFGSLYGLHGQALRSRIDALLLQVGLLDAADTPVERYSKGMKQRLQIARGLINDPRYLFLDEPTLGLDAPIARQLRKHVKELAVEHGKAILLTSHYIHEVEELCDEVYIIDKGKLVAHDTPEQLTRSLHLETALHVVIPALSDTLDTDLQKLALRHGGTREIAETDEQTWEVTLRGKTDMTTPLLSLLAAHQSPVLRLHTEQPSLEDVILHMAERRGA
ncbi:ABC transporter ATP-binding protein [Brevibacillus agri]|uniref:ABC transporter ATP-binding protein n=1 Tax=Brevibacillus TaxID=55080 RepID=UPI000271CBDB|nr:MULTISPECIES: ABC transporter ATP-binding protein [Brevibacillus]EJL47511.1 ABC-type multidrug transport system, ATPase component [Brevibacillus sp. CF112]MBG9566601.1 ABC transporter [Brevibacillus agri]MCG5252006.1 ABC transporter ATP-binding protein [Brevibacillus agri]MED1643958.1 ABC transporter ATP-binding protein [Brevibacillus agri]MED1654497.1 ABC transporter ATP-binding protein [Brevibacillus agri]